MKNKRLGEWIYVVDGGNGLYKIGITTDLDNRFALLQQGSPVELRLVHSIETKHSRNAEKFLHDRYQSKRHHGEWFSLSQQDLQEIISMSDFKIDEEIKSRWGRIADALASRQAIGQRVKKLYEVKQ